MLGRENIQDAKDARINQLIWRAFTKKHGLTLQADAVDCLKRRLDCSLDEGDLNSTFALVVEAYKKRPGYSSMVNATLLSEVIESMIRTQEGDTSADGLPLARNYFRLVNAVDCPRWEYDTHLKRFHLAREVGPPSVLGPPASKVDMFRRHYDIVRQRILQTEDFFGPNGVKLTSIKSAKGQRGEEKRLLFGMLSLIEEDWVYLEDPEDHVKLDFSPLERAEKGLYVETMMVVVGGRPNGESFLVDFICPPPTSEPTLSVSRTSLPNYGARLNPDPPHLESSYLDATVVILSELWLDCDRSMEKLNQLLLELTLNESVPSLFILTGPFLSPSQQRSASQGIKDLARGVQGLANVISRHSAFVKSCKFVLLASLADPLSLSIMPRAPLPESLLSPLRQADIDCVPASNPCRILFFSKEILLSQHNLTVALRKNQLPQLVDKSTGAEALNTVLEQGHLCPLPLSVQCRAWELDHSLTVYPPPDFLILAEHSAVRQYTQDKCQAINPGSFSAAEYSFLVLCPLRGVARPCKL